MTPALTCDELRPLLGGYVLEALEPDEAEAVRAHLPGCPACAAELASLAELPQLLDLAAPVAHPDEPLSPGSEEALLDRFARESRPAARRAPTRRRLPRIAWTRPRVAIASAAARRRRWRSRAMPALVDGDRPAGARRATTSWRCKPGAARAARRRPRIALYRVARRHRRAPVGERPASRARSGSTRCSAGTSSWSASAGTFRADAHGRVERAAHDRGAGRGIRPRQRRH